MTGQAVKIDIKNELKVSMALTIRGNQDVQLISLCTTDGFSINHISDSKINIEADKLAAMASALCSLSSSSAKQIVNQAFNITTVETNNGNVLFLSAKYLKLPCVLMIATHPAMALANARFIAKRLVDKISNIPVD